VALTHADRALTLNATHWKAMIRRAEAQTMLRNYDSAKEMLEKALQYVKEDSWVLKIKNEQRKIYLLEKEEEKKQRKVFAGVFEKANILDAQGDTDDKMEE